ncbi:MAG: DUF4349 domain-containing protein [Clostridia bacterium]|nr:DUF4349 domain-containing protein [Clostridia bacterium]
MKNMKKTCLILLLVLTLLCSLISCASSGNGGAARPGVGDSDSFTENGATSGDALITDRKIIKTVYETVETENYDDAVETLKAKVSALGGYFVSSRYTGGANAENERKASFEIRIPAEKLADFTSEVEGIAVVLSYSETADDVTLSYIDVESRISVLEAKETALLAMVEKATTTAELLEIEKYLSDIQATLASLRAQKQNYDTLVAYSTVHLDVREVLHERATDGSFFSEVGNDFMESLSAIGFFFRGVGVFLLGSSPILLLIAAIGVGVVFLIRAVLRRDKKKNETKQSQTPPADKEQE